jgi:hypothetical protein
MVIKFLQILPPMKTRLKSIKYYEIYDVNHQRK